MGRTLSVSFATRSSLPMIMIALIASSIETVTRIMTMPYDVSRSPK